MRAYIAKRTIFPSRKRRSEMFFPVVLSEGSIVSEAKMAAISQDATGTSTTGEPATTTSVAVANTTGPTECMGPPPITISVETVPPSTR